MHTTLSEVILGKSVDCSFADLYFVICPTVSLPSNQKQVRAAIDRKQCAGHCADSLALAP